MKTTGVAVVAFARSICSNSCWAIVVGEPVMQYVARWRMELALSALRDGDATVGELARRLGYRSEAAFARAFKRIVGMPPGAVRRQPAADPFSIG